MRKEIWNLVIPLLNQDFLFFYFLAAVLCWEECEGERQRGERRGRRSVCRINSVLRASSLSLSLSKYLMGNNFYALDV